MSYLQQLPYQQPYMGQPQPNPYATQPGSFLPGGSPMGASPYGQSPGRPMLLVDMFSNPALAQGGQQFPMGMPQGQAVGAEPESGGSGWKKFLVGVVGLGALGALAYKQGWWPFNGSSNGSEEGDHSSCGSDHDHHSSSDGSSSHESQQTAALQKLQQNQEKRVKKEVFDRWRDSTAAKKREREEEQARIEHEQRLKHDSEIMPNGLSRAVNRELGQNLVDAYDRVEQALNEHLKVLKSPDSPTKADVLREAGERVNKASEALEQAARERGSVSCDVRPITARIAKLKQDILAYDPDLNRQLTTAYDKVERTLKLDADLTPDKVKQVEAAFTALKDARSFRGTTGWQNTGREDRLVPLLQAYRGADAQSPGFKSYQKLKGANLILEGTATKVET